MTSVSVLRAALVGAGLVGLAAVAPAPAHAQYYGYGYGYYGYRPYYVPFYRPRVLFVPPPVYVAPVRPLIVTVPWAVPQRRVSRARAAPAVCAVAGESPFAGSGVEGVLPASASKPAAPFLAPIPGAARARPGIGDLPAPVPAPVQPAPAPPAAATPAVVPPEGAFRGD